MGNRISESLNPATFLSSSSSHQLIGRKRFAEEIIGEQDANVEDITPPRKKSKSTSDYIYDTLFRQGADSDITIKALGTEGCRQV